MAKRNSMGERESACLTPLQCSTLCPGSPFKSTLEEEVHHN
jgi:hypothetical protein